MAELYGGVITLNWHHRSIAPERLWDDVYRKTLEILRSAGGRFMTAGNLVDWFKKLRLIKFGKIRNNAKDARFLIQLAQGAAINENDDFMVRIYQLSQNQGVNRNKIEGFQITEYQLFKNTDILIDEKGKRITFNPL